MNVEKIITQLESKETLIIFLRDNFPEVLEKWKNSNGSTRATTNATNGATRDDNTR